MKVLIAPDKFKGSLSAIDVCSALTKGLKKNNSNIDIIACPMADGGDGSLQIINYYFNLKPQELIVNNPLFRPIKSTYYLSQNTAYIEMSLASGLFLLREEDRNCMFTSSFGTGFPSSLIIRYFSTSEFKLRNALKSFTKFESLNSV